MNNTLDHHLAALRAYFAAHGIPPHEITFTLTGNRYTATARTNTHDYTIIINKTIHEAP